MRPQEEEDPEDLPDREEEACGEDLGDLASDSVGADGHRDHPGRVHAGRQHQEEDPTECAPCDHRPVRGHNVFLQ